MELRERLAARGAKEALDALRAGGWSEAVVLSTCNRFEVYAVDGGSGSDASPDLSSFLELWAGAPVGAHVYRCAGAEAVRHLFSVASGLDSLVLGEGEILGQVKQAYELSCGAGAAGKLVNVLFQRALYVGKAVRRLTLLGTGQVSVASVAAELARRIFGELRGSSVLILGAGDMAEKTARHLLSAPVARLHIANRTEERGRELAAALGAEAVRWEEYPRLLTDVDIVVCSTGSKEPLLDSDTLRPAAAGRRGRSLFIIDIAMPRDVAEDVAAIDGVYLYALSDLQAIAEENAARRRSEIDSAWRIVSRETGGFSAWLEGLGRGEQISFRHKSSGVTS